MRWRVARDREVEGQSGASIEALPELQRRPIRIRPRRAPGPHAGDENQAQGSFEAVWDGRDAVGREVGSGTYLARLSFGGRVETVRMGR